MNKNKSIFVLAGFIFSVSWLFAKSNDTIPNSHSILLDSVLIRDSMSEFPITIYTDISEQNLIPYASTKIRSTTLADFLQKYTTIQVNDYGFGNAASISYRGTNDDQSTIRWNGIKVNSPSLGGTDLSLLPMDVADGIVLENNSSIGASILLKTQPNWKQRFSIKYRTDLGSFDAYKNSISLSFRTKRLYYRGSGFYLRAKNDFPFQDYYKYDHPLEREKHNELKNWAIINEFHVLLKKNSTIAFGNWYQEKDKNLPQIMGIYGESSKHQQDKNCHSYIAYYNKLNKEFSLQIQVGHSYDVLLYQDKFLPSDTAYSIYANNKTHRLDCNFESKKLFKKQGLTLNSEFRYDFLYANLPTYAQPVKVHLGSIIEDLEFQRGIIFTQVRIEQPFASYKIIRPQFAASLRVTDRNRRYAFKLDYNDKYRFPDLNDLYWNPGGNPNLKPETAWMLGCSQQLNYEKQKKIKVYFSTDFYFSRIKNNIIWQPINAVIWSPKNVGMTQLYGLDNVLRLDYRPIEKINWSIQGIYSFNRTQIITDIDHPDAKGNFLPYKPQHTFKLFTELKLGSFSLGCNYNYTARRYTDNENYSFLALKPYHMVDLLLQFSGDYKSFSGQFIFKVNNLINTQYESIRAYAQPLRNYTVSIILSLHKNNFNEN